MHAPPLWARLCPGMADPRYADGRARACSPSCPTKSRRLSRVRGQLPFAPRRV